MTSGSFKHTINMQAKGQSIVAVVLQGRYPAIVLGMKKDKAAQYKSGKDLKGMKIGVTAPGSSTNLFVSNLLAKPEYYGDDKANYKAALQKNLAALSPDGLMTMEGAKNVYNMLNAFEPSVKAAKIELEKTFDNSFAQKAPAKYR